jgi:hypothetical protein
VFFNAQPLVDFAFAPTNLQELSMSKLLDRLILQLRLTTLARSGDLARITWALFVQDGAHFIRLTDKNGALLTFSMPPRTLETLREYMLRHVYYPAPHMLRYAKDPLKILGAERIAKRTKALMASVGIDVSVFKAHSIRGAVATLLMKRGVSRELVQARGHWSSTATLDMYYARLHQDQRWEALLGGDAGTGMSACAEAPPKAPQTEDDEGSRRGGAEERSKAQDDILAAHAVLRPLFQVVGCPHCLAPIMAEAAYACEWCHRVLHVRCFPKNPDPKMINDICTRCIARSAVAASGGTVESSSPRSQGVDRFVCEGGLPGRSTFL